MVFRYSLTHKNSSHYYKLYFIRKQFIDMHSVYMILTLNIKFISHSANFKLHSFNSVFFYCVVSSSFLSSFVSGSIADFFPACAFDSIAFHVTHRSACRGVYRMKSSANGNVTKVPKSLACDEFLTKNSIKK